MEKDYNALKCESIMQNNELGGCKHGDDIQTGRRLSDTESGDGPRAGGSTYKIWYAERNIPERESQGDLCWQAAGRDINGALFDDSKAGRGES
jgi:hypothetical protein